MWSFQNHLPVHETPDLVGDWDYFYERSIGCIGILKDWLVRALFKALKDGGSCLTLKQIEKSAPSVSQVEKMLSEAIEGESLLQDSPESRTRLRTLMGLPATLSSRDVWAMRAHKAISRFERPLSPSFVDGYAGMYGSLRAKHTNLWNELAVRQREFRVRKRSEIRDSLESFLLEDLTHDA